MSQLTSAFLQARAGGAPSGSGDSDLERALEASVAEARRLHPTVRGGTDRDFAAYLGAHLHGDADPALALATARVGDLFIAFACLAGDRAALSHFSHEVLAAAAGAVRRYVDAPEDVLQTVGERLLVGRGDGRPRLADYGGAGPLETWVRVISVREAISERRRRGDVPVDDEVLLSVAGADRDPELALYRRRAAQEIKRAFHEALADLETRQRLLLRQHLIDGLSIDGLGGIYGVHRVTAARWIRKARSELWAGARRRLRAALGAEEIEGLLADVRSTLDLSIERVLRTP